MSYRHLNARERTCLFYNLQLGVSLREIGRRLNRSHSTLSRELKRNQRVIGGYCDRAAQQVADARKAIARHKSGDTINQGINQGTQYLNKRIRKN